ncbi:peptide deformylase [Alkaliphilus hydrothermalis]|uniref:Peptide deformylase n=1 Tax=Alkaliphilus hydrothermalis TaxID=1482730 RepID=A0ABS2NNJ1_9FIRM|nr:peptide deformylase [Alkaliphilus hydrothermalis]MBM7614513.1 peptide deformylase [Alkaliphilus hydrothermalis]
MAIRMIRKDDDPVLRKISKVVDKFDNKLHVLLEDMVETMYDADGVGLAAPQIGLLKRIVVIDVGDGIVELINPEIIEEKGKQTGDEGCLSLPGETGKVTRPEYVKVKAQDRSGNEIIVEGWDLMARAVCHEVDHLNGVLFTDHVKE